MSRCRKTQSLARLELSCTLSTLVTNLLPALEPSLRYGLDERIDPALTDEHPLAVRVTASGWV